MKNIISAQVKKFNNNWILYEVGKKNVKSIDDDFLGESKYDFLRIIFNDDTWIDIYRLPFILKYKK